MFDAYTVKKVIPRLVIAAILIQLSWPIFTLLIAITGNIAWGIEGLLYAPFGGREALGIGEILEKAGGAFSFATFGLLLVSGGAAIAVFGPGFMILGFMALLAVLAAFLVLAIRQVVIIVLLITAPIALVAWILPNTEGLWKMWWSMFWKALLMYPLILLLLAGGRVAAMLAAEGLSDNTSEVLKLSVATTVFFMPYFLVPKTFQFAGGAIGAASGMINAQRARVSGAAGKWSSARKRQKWGERRTRADEGRLFNPQGRLGRFNDLASTVVNPMATAHIKMGTRTGEAYKSSIAQSKWDATEKMAGVMSRAGFNDRALDALTTWDKDKMSFRDHLSAEANRLDSGDANDRIAAQQLRQNSGFLLTSFKDEEYGRANIAGAAGLALAAQGFTTPDKIATVANAMDKDMPGLGNTFKTSAELAGARSGALTKPGYSVLYQTNADGTGSWVAPSATDATRMSQIKKIGVQDIGTSKGLPFDGGNGMGDSFVHALSGASPDVSQQDAAEIQSVLANAYASYTNPAIRSNIREVLTRSEIQRASLGGMTMTEEQAASQVDAILSKGRAMSPNEIAAQDAQQQAAIDNEGKSLT